MRNWITLVESAGIMAVNKDAICAKMAEAELSGKYWDDRASANYPGKFNSVDNIADMARAWLNGRFVTPVPERFKHMYGAEFGDIDENKFSDLLVSPEFKELVLKWAHSRYDEVVAVLSQIPLRNGKYSLHRIMKVPLNFLNSQKITLGLHWTYDIESWEEPYPVWADANLSGHDLMFEALVDPQYIDWEYTILANMDWYSGDREFEMRPTKGAPLDVIDCWSVDENDTKKHFDVENKIFFA